jgi:hypothetical protein
MRTGSGSSGPAKRSSSILVAFLENTLKFTPPGKRVAPRGKGLPTPGSIDFIPADLIFPGLRQRLRSEALSIFFIFLSGKPFIIDDLVKSRNLPDFVIPAKAGIQLFQYVLDPGFRRGDAF